MIKTTLSMLFAVALPFAMVGCVATSPTESESDPDDNQAEESVGEAQSALTVSDCCLKYDTLTSSEKIGCDLVVAQHCKVDGSVPACTKTASQGGGIWMYCPSGPGGS